jgi:hypothetical protein
MGSSTGGNLLTIVIAGVVGAAAGFGGAKLAASDTASPGDDGTPSVQARLIEDVTALKDGSGQKVVPLVVRDFVTEQLQSVPHAKTADRATEAAWAETADHAVEADNARFAEIADLAESADFAEEAQEAGVAASADVALSAGEAGYAANAARAERADSLVGGGETDPRVFVNEHFIGQGYAFGGPPPDPEEEEEEERPQRNIAQEGPVTLSTRQDNVVGALFTELTLEEARPVYVALVDGSLTLDADSRGRYQLLRNGQPIHEGRVANSGEREEKQVPAGAIHTIDFPDRGRQVYTVRMIAEEGRVGIEEVRLLALEL